MSKKLLTGVDVITLGAGHSCMLGHKPKAIPLASLSETFSKRTDDKAIQSLGLFGSDIDYNTYYPDVKPEEFNPKDDEFIEPTFRLLSECIVSKNWLPTDFSKPGVLKASMGLLVGQTVNCDHETNIGNAIGSVKETVWQEAYEVNGVKIPAGINGNLKIDAKANPRIARGIMMDPPSIHSNSVTVQFAWESSHPQLSNDEFWNKLGSYDSDGQMVRRVVTKIINYKETSLVSHGADNFAQKVGDDGKIINPEYANQAYNSFAEVDVNRGFYISSDFKNPGEDVMYNTSFINNEQGNKPTKNNKQEKMDDVAKFLESLFGKDGILSLGEGKEVNQANAIAYFSTNANELASLRETNSTQLNEITSLKEEVSSLKPMADLGTARLAEVRNETVVSYKKVVGDDKAEDTILTLINNADIPTLQSLGKSYTSQLEEKFPMECKACGSHDVSRGSATPASGNNGEDSNTEKSIKDALSAIRRKK